MGALLTSTSPWTSSPNCFTFLFFFELPTSITFLLQTSRIFTICSINLYNKVLSSSSSLCSFSHFLSAPLKNLTGEGCALSSSTSAGKIRISTDLEIERHLSKKITLNYVPDSSTPKNAYSRKSSLPHKSSYPLCHSNSSSYLKFFFQEIIRSLTSLIELDGRKRPQGKSYTYPSPRQTKPSPIFHLPCNHHQQENLY